MSLQFRQAFRRDLSWRALDLFLHILAAVFLPGPYYLQWIPDFCVPVIWIHGMTTNRFLPKNSEVLRIHKWFHSVPGFALFAGTVCLLASIVHWWVPAVYVLSHYAVHLVIDSLTHESWRESQS